MSEGYPLPPQANEDSPLPLTHTNDNNGVLMESLWGSLNENVPRRLRCLNTWPPSPPVSGAVGGGGAALLEEAYHGVGVG